MNLYPILTQKSTELASDGRVVFHLRSGYLVLYRSTWLTYLSISQRLVHPFITAEELGIRLEIVAGLPIWETQPVYKHQKAMA